MLRLLPGALYLDPTGTMVRPIILTHSFWVLSCSLFFYYNLFVINFQFLHHMLD